MDGHHQGRLEDVYRANTGPSQFGDIKHGGTDMTHLHLRAALNMTSVIYCSAAALLVDVVTAFASLCRRLALPFV